MWSCAHGIYFVNYVSVQSQDEGRRGRGGVGSNLGGLLYLLTSPLLMRADVELQAV